MPPKCSLRQGWKETDVLFRDRFPQSLELHWAPLSSNQNSQGIHTSFCGWWSFGCVLSGSLVSQGVDAWILGKQQRRISHFRNSVLLFFVLYTNTTRTPTTVSFSCPFPLKLCVRTSYSSHSKRGNFFPNSLHARSLGLVVIRSVGQDGILILS